jgi:hypothetical protein
MYIVDPLLSLIQTYRWRVVTPALLSQAKANAAHTVRDARRGASKFAGNQLLNLAIGGCIPLIGKLIFDLSNYTLVCGLVIDTGSLWLSDCLKARLGPREFHRQWTQQLDSVDAFQIARSVVLRDQGNPGETRVVDRSSRLVSDFADEWLGSGWHIGLTMLIFLLVMIFRDLSWENWQMVCVVGSPFVIRMALVPISILRARHSVIDDHAWMLPQAAGPIITFYGTIVVFGLIGNALWGKTKNLESWFGGHPDLGFFAAYFLTSAIITVVGIIRLRTVYTVLRRFVETA